MPRLPAGLNGEIRKSQAFGPGREIAARALPGVYADPDQIDSGYGGCAASARPREACRKSAEIVNQSGGADTDERPR
jgi:hypothetical protein